MSYYLRGKHDGLAKSHVVERQPQLLYGICVQLYGISEHYEHPI